MRARCRRARAGLVTRGQPGERLDYVEGFGPEAVVELGMNAVGTLQPARAATARAQGDGAPRRPGEHRLPDGVGAQVILAGENDDLAVAPPVGLEQLSVRREKVRLVPRTLDEPPDEARDERLVLGPGDGERHSAMMARRVPRAKVPVQGGSDLGAGAPCRGLAIPKFGASTPAGHRGADRAPSLEGK